MALKKLKQVLGGQASADYWRVLEMNVQYGQDSASIRAVVGLFANKGKADDKAPTLDVVVIETVVQKGDFKKDLRDDVYAALKLEPAFSGSEDV